MLVVLVHYFFNLLAMAILYFLPGLFIASFLKKSTNIEKVTISFLFSTILIFLVGLLFHLFGLVWSKFLLIPFLLFSLLLILKINFLKKLLADKEVMILLFLFFSIIIFKSVLQIFIKYYPMGSDYINHYNTALFFLGSDWSTEKALSEKIVFPSRTPGFYMLIAYFLAIFGKEFWVAQIANTLINTIFILPTYCLAKELFNKKIAFLTVLFLQLIPFVEVSLYVFFKMISAYFSILFLYYLIRKKISGYFLGLIAGLSFLIHQSSFPFVVAACFPVLFEIVKTRNRKAVFDIIKILIVFLLTISPWLTPYYLTYGTFISVYGSFPIMIDPVRQENYTAYELWREFKKTPLVDIISVRVINLLTAITPVVLIFKMVSQFMPIIVQTYEVTNFTDVPWVYYYYHSLSGQLTLLLYIFACLGFLKVWKKNKELFCFVLVPIIFYSFWYGWVVLAVVRSGLPTLIPILVMVGFGEVSKIRDGNKWIKLIFILAIVEALLFSIFYSWHINLVEQIAIERNDLLRYESLFSAYKLFNVQN